MGTMNTLGKAGATSMGFQKRSQSSMNSTCSNENKLGMTSHWKTTYQGVVEESLATPASRAERPLWTLPR